MRLNFRDTLVAACDALLAGPPELAGMVARLVSVFGTYRAWMDDVAREAAHGFAPRWDAIPAHELARSLEQLPVFATVFGNASRPEVVRIVRRAPVQRPLPPGLEQVSLPRLATLRDLAEWLEVAGGDLAWLATRWRVEPGEAASPLHHYSYHAREKRDGRNRLIERPKPLLRFVQHKLLHDLLDRVPPHDAAHGFRRGRSIVSFAAPHADQPLVIRLDLADFFASITQGRVHAVFHALGYPVAVARALTALSTNRVPSRMLTSGALKDKFDWTEQRRLRARHLPQGASTSPALANLCAWRLDTRLAALAQSLDANYTRYADDLAFSGAARFQRVADRLPLWVAAIALEEGFSVQPRKTRVMAQGVRQQLAGVVVNRHPNLARDRFDALKALLTNCVRHGPASQNRDGRADFRAALAGHVAHAAMLNPSRGAKLQGIFDRIDWSQS
ncbi:reverse transcriptase family protein [Paraburkholderia acidisoli]|uniref:RNA-directed DNA polymerase n=1 Tax=Paraburkholderia acidisoli TaxID=2571748 RepID=A0A7Z2JHB6_9BURK|nr:reverse transcriptase family protein [Paraburkholderia acidisoli]QGZ64581.1 RNA-directed DNA polymerase [Paraburkholderia acidisoli]